MDNTAHGTCKECGAALEHHTGPEAGGVLCPRCDAEDIEDIHARNAPLRVTLREVYSGFANIPNGWRVLGAGVTPTPANKDDGTGRDVAVLLPAGFYVSESQARSLEVYGDDTQWDVVATSSGLPRLVSARGYAPLEVVRHSADKEG